MNCIVVDDEPFALELISNYVLKTPSMELLNSFTNPFKALSYLQNNSVDLVFLDINMPELTGLQLIKSLNNPPRVIFTTAYPEFGAESYEYNAIDYLLKPIKYERFLKAVDKIGNALDKSLSNDKNENVFIKSGTQINQVSINSIRYIEGAGNYMIFYTDSKKIMALMSMKEVSELLPGNEFVRIHKSFVVSLSHIDIIEKHRVIIQGDPVPIGITYREDFLQRFKSRKE